MRFVAPAQPCTKTSRKLAPKNANKPKKQREFEKWLKYQRRVNPNPSPEDLLSEYNEHQFRLHSFIERYKSNLHIFSPKIRPPKLGDPSADENKEEKEEKKENENDKNNPHALNRSLEISQEALRSYQIPGQLLQRIYISCKYGERKIKNSKILETLEKYFKGCFVRVSTRNKEKDPRKVPPLAKLGEIKKFQEMRRKRTYKLDDTKRRECNIEIQICLGYAPQRRGNENNNRGPPPGEELLKWYKLTDITDLPMNEVLFLCL